MTTIRYGVPYDGFIRIALYNAAGRMVCPLVNAYQRAGFYQSAIAQKNLARGVYYCRLESDAAIITQRIIIR
jgi:hypothetical protein